MPRRKEPFIFLALLETLLHMPKAQFFMHRMCGSFSILHVVLNHNDADVSIHKKKHSFECFCFLFIKAKVCLGAGLLGRGA